MLRCCLLALSLVLAAVPCLADDTGLAIKPFPSCDKVLKRNGDLGPACAKALGKHYPRLVRFMSSRVPGGAKMLLDCGQSAKDWIFLNMPKDQAPRLQKLCVPHMPDPVESIKNLKEN